MTAAVAGRRVRAQLEGRVRFERGHRDLSQGDHVAVVAHWSERAAVTRSVDQLVAALQGRGYRVVVCSSSPVGEPLAFGQEVDLDLLTVLRKPNVGYDFGSWTMALAELPHVAGARRVLLCNDSLAGPFADLGPALDHFEGTAVDVWGLTDTTQFGRHLQSYFVGYRDGVLRERPLRRFWADVRHHEDKMQTIFDCNIGLSRLLRAEGFTAAAAYPSHRVVPDGDNPVIKGWRGLLDLGFPFVKRELLRSPEVAPDGGDVPAELRRRFGVDVQAWVDEEVAA